MSEWTEVEELKIWASQFHRYLDLVNFEWVSEGDGLEFVHAFRDLWQTVDPAVAPKFLFFKGATRPPEKTKDAFRVFSGVQVISKELRDILVQFDIGNTQLFEVPICQDEKGTPSDLPNHYVLNVNAPKNALIPELSEGIKSMQARGHTEASPNIKWRTVVNTEVLALDAEAALAGADLWHDPIMKSTIFFSDRLKRAIDDGGLKVHSLQFKPTRLFTKQ